MRVSCLRFRYIKVAVRFEVAMAFRKLRRVRMLRLHGDHGHVAPDRIRDVARLGLMGRKSTSSDIVRLTPTLSTGKTFTPGEENAGNELTEF